MLLRSCTSCHVLLSDVYSEGRGKSLASERRAESKKQKSSGFPRKSAPVSSATPFLKSHLQGQIYFASPSVCRFMSVNFSSFFSPHCSSLLRDQLCHFYNSGERRAFVDRNLLVEHMTLHHDISIIFSPWKCFESESPVQGPLLSSRMCFHKQQEI